MTNDGIKEKLPQLNQIQDFLIDLGNESAASILNGLSMYYEYLPDLDIEIESGVQYDAINLFFEIPAGRWANIEAYRSEFDSILELIRPIVAKDGWSLRNIKAIPKIDMKATQ